MGLRRDVLEGGGEGEGLDDEGHGVLHDAHDEVANGGLHERNRELEDKDKRSVICIYFISVKNS